MGSKQEKCHGNRESFQLQIKNHRIDNSFQSSCQKVGEKTSGQRSGQRESTASSEEKRNNNGVEQKKIRAYGEQQLVRVIPVIKRNQSKRTQDNVRSISK